MASAPRAVLFDLDGVLIDSFDVWVAVLGDCCSARGLPRPSSDVVRRHWGQGIAADSRTLVRGANPRDLAGEYVRGFERHADRVREIPGARALVRRLRDAGLRLAVVTNSPVRIAEQALAGLGVSADFETICGGDEVAEGKPDPAVVRLALERLGVEPPQAAMIGDTDLDVRAARAAGVHAIGLRVEADVTVSCLEDVDSAWGGD